MLDEAETVRRTEAIQRERLRVERERLKRLNEKLKPTGFAHPRNWHPRNWGRGWEEERKAPYFALILLSALLYIADYLWFGFNGIDISIFLKRVFFGPFQISALKGLGDLAGIFVNPIIIGYVAYYLLTHRHRDVPLAEGFFSRLALVWTVSAIFFLGGLTGGTAASLFHFGYVFILYFWLLRPAYSDDSPRSERIITVLLLIDFFGYGILHRLFPLFTGNEQILSLLSNRFIFPILFLYTVYKCYEFAPEKKWIMFISLGIVLIYVFYFGWMVVQINNLSITVPEEQREEVRDFTRTVKDNFKNWVGQLFTDIKRSTEAQLEYATGGYYVGTVEKNEKEQLGVYLQNIEAADTRFLEGENVILWGDLKARTLDEPIYVYMSCKSGDVEGDIFPGVLSKSGYSDDYHNGYEIQKLEEIGFECRFDAGELKPGTNTVKIKAEFNFETLAFLKTYFMDVERVRALRRENIDPLGEYGVGDKTPTAVFTNGPVRLGMGTIDPPLGIYPDNYAYSFVGVTVERQWIGQIKSISGLTIQVPKFIELDPSGDFFCRGDFKKVKDTDDGYAVYNMTDIAIENIKTPIGQYRSWRCSMKVPKASEEVLGNTPLATYYYRAGVKYIYEIDESININIKSVAGEKTRLTRCDITCYDSDGCVCDTDKCAVDKGTVIVKGDNCNSTAVAASTARTVDEDLGYIEAWMQYIDAMIKFNEICMEGDVERVRKAINESVYVEEKDKEPLKKDPVLTEGCATASPLFFEITEDLIVKKVEDVRDIFVDVLDSDKARGEDYDKIFSKKEEFVDLLDTVIKHFEENYSKIKDEKTKTRIEKVKGIKDELEPMGFD